MPGPHYAISEAVIVVAAGWIAYRFAAERAFYGAAGVAILGAAAAIGTVRFGLGWNDELASLHGSVSQIGGAVAMALVALQFAAKFEHWRDRIGRFGPPVLAFATLVAGLVEPDLTTSLFALWLVLAICLAMVWPGQRASERMTRGAMVAVFLANILLVRRSPTLGPDLSWHLFHTLIAVWIVGIWSVWIQHRISEAEPK